MQSGPISCLAVCLVLAGCNADDNPAGTANSGGDRDDFLASLFVEVDSTYNSTCHLLLVSGRYPKEIPRVSVNGTAVDKNEGTAGPRWAATVSCQENDIIHYSISMQGETLNSQIPVPPLIRDFKANGAPLSISGVSEFPRTDSLRLTWNKGSNASFYFYYSLDSSPAVPFPAFTANAITIPITPEAEGVRLHFRTDPRGLETGSVPDAANDKAYVYNYVGFIAYEFVVAFQ